MIVVQCNASTTKNTKKRTTKDTEYFKFPITHKPLCFFVKHLVHFVVNC